MPVDLHELSEAIIEGEQKRAAELTKRALEAGEEPGLIIETGLMPGMAEVGRRFKAGDYFIPEVMYSARAMHASLDLLRPLLVGDKARSSGKVLIGTVKGDMHDIGKNMVVMMLEGAGFQVVDLGLDVSPERFIEAIREHKPDVVGMSALITPTMVMMRTTVEAIKEAGLCDKVKIMVGGAPITQRYADEIGADGFAIDAASAAEVARDLVASKR